MDLNLNPEEEVFRQELNSWLKLNLPEEWKGEKLLSLPEEEAYGIRRDWQLKLGSGGWLGLAWPREYGGRGATVMEQVIFQDEMLKADAPEIVDGAGLTYVGPVIVEAGTDEQKRKFLGPIIRGESHWYEGFSEPNAGSDLAGLQTRADLDGDDYVINGQKLWGGAVNTNWGIILARTDVDAPKHHGISLFIVDMTTPGITPGKVRTMADTFVGECYFDNVRIPRANILGPVNEGWRVATRVLAHERGATLILSRVAKYEAHWKKLREYAHRTRRNGQLLADSTAVQERMAASYVDVQLFRLTNVIYLTRYVRGDMPGLETSIMKLLWASTAQNLAELTSALVGPEVLCMPGSPWAIDEGEWTQEYLMTRAVTIYGGTQDIQRNIIAERMFGLPRGS